MRDYEDQRLEAPNYSEEIREELRALLTDVPPGEWGQLGLCPGRFGCTFESK